MATDQPGNRMRIRLSEDRKRVVLNLLKAFYLEELDEELSSYQAERILEFFMKTLGPSVYNQAISDARAFMLGKLDDLDAEFYEPEDNS